MPLSTRRRRGIIERFGQAGVAAEKILIVKDTFLFTSRNGSADFIETFRKFYGPTMNAFEAAEKNGKLEELHIAVNRKAETVRSG